MILDLEFGVYIIYNIFEASSKGAHRGDAGRSMWGGELQTVLSTLAPKSYLLPSRIFYSLLMIALPYIHTYISPDASGSFPPAEEGWCGAEFAVPPGFHFAYGLTVTHATNNYIIRHTSSPSHPDAKKYPFVLGIWQHALK